MCFLPYFDLGGRITKSRRKLLELGTFSQKPEAFSHKSTSSIYLGSILLYLLTKAFLTPTLIVIVVDWVKIKINLLVRFSIKYIPYVFFLLFRSNKFTKK